MKRVVLIGGMLLALTAEPSAAEELAIPSGSMTTIGCDELRTVGHLFQTAEGEPMRVVEVKRTRSGLRRTLRAPGHSVRMIVSPVRRGLEETLYNGGAGDVVFVGCATDWT